MLGAFVSLDPAGAGLALLAVALGARLSGIPAGPLVRRSAPLVLAACGIGLFNGVVAGDAVAGLAVALRLLAVGLAGIVALATMDPTELADALVEHLRAPARFAVGTLAALRLLPLFAREWEVRGLARRARDIARPRDGRSRLRLAPLPHRRAPAPVPPARRHPRRGRSSRSRRGRRRRPRLGQRGSRLC